MPDGVPCTICSHSNASALTCASVSGMLKQSAIARITATARAAEAPSPLARGRSGNTSTRIPWVSMPSRCVISAVTRTGRSESADSRAAAPPPGMTSSTPAGCGVTLARIDRPIGAAIAWYPYTTECSPSRMILPKPTFPNPALPMCGIGAVFGAEVRSSPPVVLAWSAASMASRMRRAFHTLISPLSISLSTTSANILPSAPAATATLRACRRMCPCWMPSVDSARSAAKFCASPTAAITCGELAPRSSTPRMP